MAQFTEGFRGLGLEWIPSAGNFVAVRVAPGGDAGGRQQICYGRLDFFD